MLETLHRIGARVRGNRHRHTRFWARIEPHWQRVFERLTAGRGFSTQVNDDVFKLTYAFGSRYDRYDRRAYEPSFHREFTRRIREGMQVFDIGAHIGMFTLAAAKRVTKNGRVYAFEPAPDTAEVLERHIKFNQYQEQVEVVKAVVSDALGVVPFYVRGLTMSASLGRANVEELSPENPLTPAQMIEVPSVTLDKFCDDRGIIPDLVKIDTEGAELRVLRGARNLLRTKQLTILCEIHPVNMESCGASFTEFHNFLESVGYCMLPLDEPNQLGNFHALITRSA